MLAIRPRRNRIFLILDAMCKIYRKRAAKLALSLTFSSWHDAKQRDAQTYTMQTSSYSPSPAYQDIQAST
jgi:hypothetical protein